MLFCLYVLIISKHRIMKIIPVLSEINLRLYAASTEFLIIMSILTTEAVIITDVWQTTHVTVTICDVY